MRKIAFALSPVVCILTSPLCMDTHRKVCVLLGCSESQEGRVQAASRHLSPLLNPEDIPEGSILTILDSKPMHSVLADAPSVEGLRPPSQSPQQNCEDSLHVGQVIIQTIL